MTNPVDLELARWVADHRTAPVTDACRFLEDLGRSPLFFGLATLAVVAVAGVRRQWGALLAVCVAGFITLAVTAPLKDVFDRPRPPADLAITTLSEAAMPSSHAIVTSTAVVAVLMAPWWSSARARRTTAYVGVVGCVVAAAAMIYLGGHWLTDVLVGWALGGGITAATMLVWRRLPVPGGRRATGAAA